MNAPALAADTMCMRGALLLMLLSGCVVVVDEAKPVDELQPAPDSPLPPPQTPPDNPEQPDQPAVPTPPPACDSIEATLTSLSETFAGSLQSEQVPGGAFAVAAGDCLFTFGVGVDREGAPIGAHTRFQVASISKVFAAVTANSLAEDGVVNKQAPVSSIITINDAAPFNVSFTLEDLLAHRSGYAGWFVNDTGNVTDRGAFFASFAQEPLWAAPDAVYVYNNQAYALAGHVLEEAAGASFASLVESRVVDALALADTRLGTTLDPDEPGAAAGHIGDASTRIGPDDAFFRSELYEPMGGVWSSVHDLATFGQAIAREDGRLLSSTSIRDLATSRGPTSGTGGGYGQGLEIYGDCWTHSGMTSGYLSSLMMAPSRDVVVAVVANADWWLGVYDFGYAALDALAPALDYGPWPETTPAADWVGTYEDNVILGRVVVTAEGENLVMTLQEMNETITAVPAWDDTYFGDVFDWGSQEIVMQRGPDGSRYITSRSFIAKEL